MAYIYCAKCRWSQDDFWSPKGYHPLADNMIGHLKEDLFKDKVYFDKHCLEDMGITPLKDEKGWYCEGKTYVAAELLRRVKKILNMQWKTSEEFRSKHDFKCPKCGSTKWGED
jgi:hypothetical protein